MTPGREDPDARTGQPGASGGTVRSLLVRPDTRTDAGALPIRVRAVVSTLGIVAQGLVRLCYSLLIGRTLAPGFLSATNSAISTGLLASLLWPTSLGAAAAKFLAREAGDPDVRAALTRHLGRWCLATSAVLAVVSGVVTYVWLAPGHTSTAVLVGCLTVGWSTYTYVRSFCYATQRVLRATVWDVASFVVSVGGLVGVLLFGAVDLLLLPIAVGYLAYAVAGWPRGQGGSLSVELRREITGFVTWGVVGSLSTAGFLQLTMVIARQTGDVTSADAYAAALTLATPASMVSSVLSLLLLPALAGAVGRGDLAGLRRHTDLAQRGLVALVGAIFGTLVVGSRLLVDVLWPNLSGAVPVLQILLVATFLLTATSACGDSITSRSSRGPRVVGTVRSVGFALGLLVVALLARDGSVTGIASGYLCGMAVMGVAPFVLVWRRDRQPWGRLTFRIVLGSVATFLLVVGRDHWSPGGLFDLVPITLFVVVWLVLFRQDVLTVARRSSPRSVEPVDPPAST